MALGHYTHEKSPLGAAAALAAIEVIERENLLARARDLGARGRGRMEKLAARLPFIRAHRHLGAFFGIDIGDWQGMTGAARADEIMYRSLADGLSFKVGGGTVITLCPPLTISDEDFDHAFDILERGMA